jgi:hypothetical protein
VVAEGLNSTCEKLIATRNNCAAATVLCTRPLTKPLEAVPLEDEQATIEVHEGGLDARDHAESVDDKKSVVWSSQKAQSQQAVQLLAEEDLGTTRAMVRVADEIGMPA